MLIAATDIDLRQRPGAAWSCNAVRRVARGPPRRGADRMEHAGAADGGVPALGALGRAWLAHPGRAWRPHRLRGNRDRQRLRPAACSIARDHRTLGAGVDRVRRSASMCCRCASRSAASSSSRIACRRRSSGSRARPHKRTTRLYWSQWLQHFDYLYALFTSVAAPIRTQAPRRSWPMRRVPALSRDPVDVEGRSTAPVASKNSAPGVNTLFGRTFGPASCCQVWR